MKLMISLPLAAAVAMLMVPLVSTSAMGQEESGITATPDEAPGQTPGTETNAAPAGEPTPALEPPALEPPVLEPPASEPPAAAGDAKPAKGYVHRDRYESALDIKVTSFIRDQSYLLAKHNYLLTAQWNYRFVTNTYLGFTLSGFPMAITERVDDVRTRHTVYYGGLNLAQGIYEKQPLRVVAGISGGQGYAYTRREPFGQDTEIYTSKFKFLEPFVMATFIRFVGLETGVVVAHRVINLENKDYARDRDVSGTSFGVTFRNMR